jgi:uncharacterized membrane protein YhfC
LAYDPDVLAAALAPINGRLAVVNGLSEPVAPLAVVDRIVAEHVQVCAAVQVWLAGRGQDWRVLAGAVIPTARRRRAATTKGRA